MTLVLAADTEAISYDIWETLLTGNQAYTAVRLGHINQRMRLGRSADELLMAYRASNKFYNDDAETTSRDGGMGPRLRHMYDTLGIPVDELPDAATLDVLQRELGELRCRDEYMPSLIEPDLLDTLARLQNLGLRQVLLSNSGMDGELIMRPTLEKLSIMRFIEHAFFSATVGFAKPNPVFYQYILDGLGLPAQRILHVGDNIVADYNGSRASGFQAVLFDKKYNRQEPAEVPIITRIAELPDLLSQAAGV